MLESWQEVLERLVSPKPPMHGVVALARQTSHAPQLVTVVYDGKEGWYLSADALTEISFPTTTVVLSTTGMDVHPSRVRQESRYPLPRGLFRPAEFAYLEESVGKVLGSVFRLSRAATKVEMTGLRRSDSSAFTADVDDELGMLLGLFDSKGDLVADVQQLQIGLVHVPPPPPS